MKEGRAFVKRRFIFRGEARFAQLSVGARFEPGESRGVPGQRDQRMHPLRFRTIRTRARSASVGQQRHRRIIGLDVRRAEPFGLFRAPSPLF